jgi:predicted O-methyltransferase YrrM
MEYSEFSARFGGSFRTKHLCFDKPGIAGRVASCLRFLTNQRSDRFVNKRFFPLSHATSLPRGFIRLEPWEAEYLYLLASRARHGIVEVGRFYGGSTFLMACANGETPLWSIDIAPQDDARLRRYLETHDVGRNVRLIVGDSQKTSYPQIGEIDVLFIDGDHSYQGCTSDLENWYPKLRPGGHVVLHDCYFGSEVQSSVLDFIDRHDVQMVRSPYIIGSHWHTSYGSMTHFIKPAREAKRAA